MFTGLVEGLGRIARVESESSGRLIVVQPPSSLLMSEPDLVLPTKCGDSIAINGCCLTIISLDDGFWTFQAGPETLSKTNLGKLIPNEYVNLERSLPATGRLGGHFVQGHVDGVGTVDQLERDSDWTTLGFRVAPELSELMVVKGSVCVDGVSLTIVTVEPDRFTVSLIPHTLAVTTLGKRSIGDSVNIETDILGKYARKFLDGIRL